MPASPVLDSFALLSFLRDEPGAEMVAALLEKAEERRQPLQMTEVNYAEVQSIVRRKDGEAAWRIVADELATMPIEFRPADRPLADQVVVQGLSSAGIHERRRPPMRPENRAARRSPQMNPAYRSWSAPFVGWS